MAELVATVDAIALMVLLELYRCRLRGTNGLLVDLGGHFDSLPLLYTELVSLLTVSVLTWWPELTGGVFRNVST